MSSNITSVEVSEALVQAAQKLTGPKRFKTFTMDELYDMTFDHKPVIIQNLLYSGLYILAGPPKIGKSFLVAQLAYHVAAGKPLWQYDTEQGSVLYLALEDPESRLQNRMYRLFSVDSTPNLHFTVVAEDMNNGLMEQMTTFVQEHPDAKMIIIDTLQKIRKVSKEQYSYGSDYDIIGRLKKFADEHHICLMVVHHTRKQMADDKFDQISGTNGLLGAADAAIMVSKSTRLGNTTTLDIVGRDQPDQQLILKRDPDSLSWELDHVEVETWQQPADPVLEQISKWLASDWTGTATELCALLETQMQPNAFSRHLNVNKSRLLSDYNIDYQSTRTHAGRSITLRRIVERDATD